jgi:hypothetical protein
MANRHAAYKAVMGELRGKIKEHSASKYHKEHVNTEDYDDGPEEHEPDGDEDEEGKEYPGSPDDMTPVENVSETRSKWIEKEGSDECAGCGRDLPHAHKYCGFCGKGK